MLRIYQQVLTEQAKTLAAVNRKLETVEDGLHDVTQDLGELQVLHCSEGAHAFACIFVFCQDPLANNP